MPRLRCEYCGQSLTLRRILRTLVRIPARMPVTLHTLDGATRSWKARWLCGACLRVMCRRQDAGAQGEDPSPGAKASGGRDAGAARRISGRTEAPARRRAQE